MKALHVSPARKVLIQVTCLTEVTKSTIVFYILQLQNISGLFEKLLKLFKFFIASLKFKIFRTYLINAAYVKSSIFAFAETISKEGKWGVVF